MRDTELFPEKDDVLVEIEVSEDDMRIAKEGAESILEEWRNTSE